jgi:DNA-binding transcriptional MocR family regulator
VVHIAAGYKRPPGPLESKLVSTRATQLAEMPALLGEWRNGSGSLAERLATAIEQAIERGELLEGWSLPSERNLASGLDVSRSSIVRSMQILAERGAIRRVHGAGNFVTGPPRATRPASLPPSLRLKYQLGSNTDPGIIAATIPSSSDLPPEALTLSATDLLEAHPGGERSGSGYNLAGLSTTRRAIASLLSDHDFPTAPESLIITTGATQSLSLALGQMLAPGDVVVVESPTYPTTLDLLRRVGVRVVSVGTGDAAIDTNALARAAMKARAKMVVVMSTCNVATGHSVDAGARPALVALADAGITVVDDHTLADYHPAPRPRAVAALSDHRNIITVGSFNKIYWGGLRIGWLRTHPSLVESLIRTKSKTDAGSSVPSQIILTKLIPHHDAIVENRRSQVARRAEHVRRIIHNELSDWRVEGAGYGPSMWVRLPVHDSAKFVAFAYRNGTAVGYGGMYRSDGRAAPHIRLTLTSSDEDVANGLADLKIAWSAFPGSDGTPNNGNLARTR